MGIDVETWRSTIGNFIKKQTLKVTFTYIDYQIFLYGYFILLRR